MAIKLGYLPKNGYTKMDNRVCLIKGLTDQAYRLYGYLAGQKDGHEVYEKKIMAVLNWSDKKVRRYKKELVELDLLYLENVFKTHKIYVGSTHIGAKRVRDIIVSDEDDMGHPIEPETLKELRKYR